jgi:hypothetical protein
MMAIWYHPKGRKLKIDHSSNHFFSFPEIKSQWNTKFEFPDLVRLILTDTPPQKKLVNYAGQIRRSQTQKIIVPLWIGRGRAGSLAPLTNL